MLSWLGGSTDVDMVFGLPAGTATARVRENWSLARIHPAPILSFEDKPVKPQEHQLLHAFWRLWPSAAPLVCRGGAGGALRVEIAQPRSGLGAGQRGKGPPLANRPNRTSLALGYQLENCVSMLGVHGSRG